MRPGSRSANGPRCSIVGVSGRVHVLTDLLNRGRFTGQRVGTILCRSNISTEDVACWVLGTAETQPRGGRRAPSNDPFE
jgi:hypothetical protein